MVIRRSPRHGRLGGLFRLPLALAAGIMVLGWWVAAVLAAIAAWPFLLARRPYPGTLLRVTGGWVEFSTRASCYAFMLTPAFPRLSADGPVDVALPEPSRRPWLRLPAVVSAWPVLVLEGVVSLLCSVVAWFAVVILGRLPDGMAEVMEQPQRYRTRFWAYALLLCDTYPWFQPEQPVPDPGVVIGGE
ncbi:MAG: DUF4389 domain-containing protein [Streptosporangiaceae bacterium]